MDNRKRQRLEVTPTVNAINQAVPMSLSTAAIAPSFFLSATSSSDHHPPANNVLLALCEDDNHDIESPELLSIDEPSAHIKQEDPSPVTLQYRLINPLHATIAADDMSQKSGATSTILPSTVQLPSGCDIYLVKEYIETPADTVSSADISSTKLEADSNFVPNATLSVQHSRNISCLKPKTLPTTIAAATSMAAEPNSKSHYILEKYKKRDDKRRATHNEVERRRRDKINSWIFKLKEMLPESSTLVKDSVASTANIVITPMAGNAAMQQEQRNLAGASCRTPLNDSKSQILIKACEYIGAMQEEIESLRKCLRENENLRLSNQRLQDEMRKLKSDFQARQFDGCLRLGMGMGVGVGPGTATAATVDNVQSSHLSGKGAYGVGVAPITTATYAKRELIITDHVD